MEDYSYAGAAPSSTTSSGVSALPLILDGNFFKVIAEDGLKVTGQCTLCPSRIMGLKTTTSNFNTHLKKMHPERHRIYEEYKIEKGQAIKKRRISHEGRGIIQYASSKRQADLELQNNGSTLDLVQNDEPIPTEDDMSSPKSSNQLDTTQKRKQSGTFQTNTNLTARHPVIHRRSNGSMIPKLGSVAAASLPPIIKARRKETDDVVFSFIIKSLSPPALVESTHFTSLVSGLCANPRRVMSQNTLETRINMQSLVKRTKIARSLNIAEIICLTIDAWTVTTEPINTFIAVTAHWIGRGFKVQSGLLTCQRFQQDLTYHKLISVMYEILTVYSIPSDKIGCIVTNNASSLLPTRIYQIQPEDENDQLHSYQNVGGPTSENLAFYNISSILSEALSNDELPPDFPSHYDCPTQTLIGVLAMAIFETMSNPDHLTSYVFQSAIIKCQALWSVCANKEAGERIQEQYGLEILIPNRLNWGSYLEAIDCLLAGRDVLEGIFLYFELPELDKKEVDFLEEYVKTMDPITEALNLLQDPYIDSYMGSFVPNILTIRAKLEALKDANLRYTMPLVESLLAGLGSPFMDIISLDERARPLILASILHPMYKLCWIPEDKMDELKGWYLEEAGNFGRVVESNAKCKNMKKDSDSLDSESYAGVEVENGKENVSSILVEFLDYLDAPCEPVDGGQLDLFPNVKKLFVTFNTAIASSVRVEKMVNFSEVSFAPSTAVLSNELLEKMLMLKCNQVN